jgi:hypothetical protein
MTDTWELCDAPFGTCGLHTDRNGQPKCTIAWHNGNCPGVKQMPELGRLPAIRPVMIDDGVDWFPAVAALVLAVCIASACALLVALVTA